MKRYIEFTIYVIFHEEVVFLQTKNLPKDLEEYASKILDSEV